MKTTKQVIIRMESGIAGYDFYKARKVSSNGKVSYEFLSKILNKSPEAEAERRFNEIESLLKIETDPTVIAKLKAESAELFYKFL